MSIQCPRFLSLIHLLLVVKQPRCWILASKGVKKKYGWLFLTVSIFYLHLMVTVLSPAAVRGDWLICCIWEIMINLLQSLLVVSERNQIWAGEHRCTEKAFDSMCSVSCLWFPLLDKWLSFNVIRLKLKKGKTNSDYTIIAKAQAMDFFTYCNIFHTVAEVYINLYYKSLCNPV